MSNDTPECSNPYCTDGYVDKAGGTQDGRYSWVDQVPCQICNADDELPSAVSGDTNDTKDGQAS